MSAPVAHVLPYEDGSSLGMGYFNQLGLVGCTRAQLFENLTPNDGRQPNDLVTRLPIYRSTSSFSLVTSKTDALDSMDIEGALGLNLTTGVKVNVRGAGAYISSSFDRDSTIQIVASTRLDAFSMVLNPANLKVSDDLTKNGDLASAGTHFVSETVFGGSAIFVLTWKFHSQDYKNRISAKIHGEVQAKQGGLTVDGKFSMFVKNLFENSNFSFGQHYLGDVDPRDIFGNATSISDSIKAQPTIVMDWLVNFENALLKKDEEVRKALQAENDEKKKDTLPWTAYTPVRTVITPLATLKTYQDALKTQEALKPAKPSDSKTSEVSMSQGQLGLLINAVEGLLVSIDELGTFASKALNPAKPHLPRGDKLIAEQRSLVESHTALRDLIIASVQQNELNIPRALSDISEAVRKTKMLMANVEKKLQIDRNPPSPILMFSGSKDTIPVGYVLCDGKARDKAELYKTPDLSDTFLVGSGTQNSTFKAGTSGSGTSTHGHFSFSGLEIVLGDAKQPHTHTHEIQSKQVNAQPFPSGSKAQKARCYIGAPPKCDPYKHNHGGSLVIEDSELHGPANTDELRPPWYALCYIMPKL